MNREATLAQLMGLVREQFSYEELCRLSPEAKTQYQALLTHFETVNNSAASTHEKGAALEELVSFLFKISGNVFSIVKNVRTSTNEIDEIVQLNSTGTCLLANGLLPKRLSAFLGECKNYNTSVSVTYVGKFYSLLQSTELKTGILFSYYGISGQNWSDGAGLVKKLYLQRENEPSRVAILEFSISDFRAILDGHNFFELIEAKLKALQFDTSVSAFISKHPAEALL